MYKILVSDYDKTFYTNDIDFKLNLDAVNRFKSKGNMFIFATGRSYSDFKDILNDNNIKYDYLILNHGAQIMDNNGNVLINNIIDKESIIGIEKYFELDKSTRFFCCSTTSDRTDFSSDDLIKINIRYKSTDILYNVYLNLKEKYNNYINIYIASDYTLEIVSKDSSKSKGIDYLVQKNTLEKNNIYTIGDGDSDVDMINEYKGFCMNNSIDKLNDFKKYESVHELIDDILEERV